MENKNNIEKTEQHEKVEVEEKLDKEAFQVIKRLYDKTFKELVER